MDIKEKFLQLTSRTYPHGHEEDIFPLLPKDLDVDQFGNLYKYVGERPSTMFTSHLDTAGSTLTDITHEFDGDLIKTDGFSILGADDKAGVTIMLYMIENNIPGLYYFFLGEEVGCVGSKKVAELHKSMKVDGITKVISFDRRGTTSIITHQASQRCCSDEFGEALANALNNAGAEVYDNDTVLSYKNDPTGLYTDSAQFIKIYPECTNISVGYQHEHNQTEQQNIKHLDKLAKAAVLVDWESLPVSRDPSKVEYRDYGYDSYGYNRHSPTYWDDWDGAYSTGISTRNSGTYSNSYQENIWFKDEYNDNYVSYVTINKYSKQVVKVDLSDGRIEEETIWIGELLSVLDVSYSSINWDGYKLIISYDNNYTTEMTRNDLSEYISELDFWKEIKEKQEKEDADFLDRDIYD
jgi:Peptidase family M28